jgi:hypothetical protein
MPVLVPWRCLCRLPHPLLVVCVPLPAYTQVGKERATSATSPPPSPSKSSGGGGGGGRTVELGSVSDGGEAAEASGVRMAEVAVGSVRTCDLEGGVGVPSRSFDSSEGGGADGPRLSRDSDHAHDALLASGQGRSDGMVPAVSSQKPRCATCGARASLALLERATRRSAPIVTAWRVDSESTKSTSGASLVHSSSAPVASAINAVTAAATGSAKTSPKGGGIRRRASEGDAEAEAELSEPLSPGRSTQHDDACEPPAGAPADGLPDAFLHRPSLSARSHPLLPAAEAPADAESITAERRVSAAHRRVATR